MLNIVTVYLKGGIGLEGILKVTPEKLMQASSEFEASAGVVNNITQEMLSIINNLKGVWQGEAASGYTNRFNGLSDDIDKINRMIAEHVADLNEMANEYQMAENESLEQANALNMEVVD